MPDDPSPEPRQPRQPSPPSVGWWWRFLMVTLGLVGLGSGGVAVFVTQLEAGPVALLAVGLVLLLVAAGGRLPSRLKVGDSEATWDAVEEFVERVAEGVSPDQRPELVEALNDLRRAAPAAAAAGLGTVTGGVAYERLVMDLVLQTITEINKTDELSKRPLRYSLEGYSGSFQTITQAVISGPGSKLLLIEPRFISGEFVPILIVEQVLRKGMQFAQMTSRGQKSVGLLLVSNRSVEPLGLARLYQVTAEQNRIGHEMLAAFQHIEVTSQADLPEVLHAIRTVFDLPTK